MQYNYKYLRLDTHCARAWVLWCMYLESVRVDLSGNYGSLVWNGTPGNGRHLISLLRLEETEMRAQSHTRLSASNLEHNILQGRLNWFSR